jgi:hypothetical protein
MTDDLLPSFSFSPEEIANIKASVGAVDVDETQDTPLPEIAPKRRPGRPRKNPIIEIEEPKSETFTDKIPAAPLTRREEKEVAVRLANILSGGTGMLGVVKPYIPMTDEEATAIAEPLSSYLIRNEATSGIAREILENYDIVAMIFGVGSYGVRVYNDRKQELRDRRPPNTTAIQRISTADEPVNGRDPDEGISDRISIPNASRGGTTPFDL